MNAISQPVATGPRFTPDELALLRRTMMVGATDDEFKLFVYQCERTGLDPFTRQIYAVKRWDARAQKNIWQTQTSIDGLRLTAERSGKYAGQVGPFWCGKDGEWRDVWLSTEPPAAARIGVMRHDFKEPCWGVARFDAYAQKKKEGGLSAMWAGMGDVMVAKCSEALALRKAFPQQLSGLYTGDEMAQATVEDPDAQASHPVATKATVMSDDPFADPPPTAGTDESDWPAYIAGFKRDFLASCSFLASKEIFNRERATLKALRAERPQAYAALAEWMKTEGDKLPRNAA